MRVTVLGGRGFVGGHVAALARAQGHDVVIPPRDARPVRGENLGHVIYAIGLTASFRTRPFETAHAHVSLLSDWLQGADFTSFLYLSSTRLYGRLAPGLPATEDAALAVSPSLDSLYDLSKLLGEALCLSRENPAVRVARLSNIYGPGMSDSTFLGSVLHDLRTTGRVTIGEDPASAKDYLHVEDAARLLLNIATGGAHRSYNVASGQPISHSQIAQSLSAQRGLQIDFAANAPLRAFPVLDIRRIAAEFASPAHSLIADLAALFQGAPTNPSPEHDHAANP